MRTPRALCDREVSGRRQLYYSRGLPDVEDWRGRCFAAPRDGFGVDGIVHDAQARERTHCVLGHQSKEFEEISYAFFVL